MITEEMLREAVHKAAELMAAYYERDYDPQKEIAVSPEFEKRMQDIIDGKLQDSEMRFAASSEDGCLRDNKLFCDFSKAPQNIISGGALLKRHN